MLACSAIFLELISVQFGHAQEELRELRRQLGVGRSLKDGSQPEYEEKLNRLQQQRTVRNNYQAKMVAIKDNLRGLECKSEGELEARVKELEDRISHGSLLLREEKMVVGQISKLQSQRAQVSLRRGREQTVLSSWHWTDWGMKGEWDVRSVGS